MVGRSRLAGEQEHARRHRKVGLLPQPVVEDHDVHRVQQLSLVFMDALDVAVEDGIRIDAVPGG